MKTSELGETLYESCDVIDVIYTHGLDAVYDLHFLENEDIVEYNNNLQNLGLDPLNTKKFTNTSIDDYDAMNQSTWFMPSEYQNIDILEYCLSKCVSETEEDRVKIEYVRYQANNMIPLLQYMIYFIEILNKNKIVTGVGRGSSVSSFILYLIGVHKINPLKYNLDCNEFFKDEAI